MEKNTESDRTQPLISDPVRDFRHVCPHCHKTLARRTWRHHQTECGPQTNNDEGEDEEAPPRNK